MLTLLTQCDIMVVSITIERNVMKEYKFSDKNIIKTLDKKGFIEICPICHECALVIMELVFNNFPSVNFNIMQVEDETFMLKINV